jgi:glycyl-tRNA synthetase (class II)
MDLLRNNFSILLLCVIASSGANAAYGRDHSRDWGELRGVVDRTQSDLQAASGLQHGDKQRARVQHAQDDLSKLDRKLVKGKFDKEAFEHSLGAIKAILNHNTLPVSGRDALMRDLSSLQAAFERR